MGLVWRFFVAFSPYSISLKQFKGNNAHSREHVEYQEIHESGSYRFLEHTLSSFRLPIHPSYTLSFLSKFKLIDKYFTSPDNNANEAL